jgi:hypothetical protein
LKLHLWTLSQYSRICYFDADTIVTQNVDELLSALQATFTGAGEYSTGAMFVCTPNIEIYKEMLRELERYGTLYLYGEQDFLNHFFGRLFMQGNGREVLSREHYHCLAEDFGYTSKLPAPLETCKVVEFSSCISHNDDDDDDDDGRGKIRWKPWMEKSLIVPIDHQEGEKVVVHTRAKRICKNIPTELFFKLVDLWRFYFFEIERII